MNKQIAIEKQRGKKLKTNLEMVKSEKASEEFICKIWDQIQEEKLEKTQAELEHQKWLEERDQKISQMKATRILHGAAAAASQKSKANQMAALQSPKNETEIAKTGEINNTPLTVDVSDVVLNSSVSQENETKITPVSHSSGHSTSPLLTSLLQSPTPSSTVLSPNLKSSSPTKEPLHTSRQSPSSAQHYPFFSNQPSSRQFMMSSESDSPFPSFDSSSERKSTFENVSSTNNTVSSAPTLSRLLEMPPSEPGKLPPLPIIEQRKPNDSTETRQTPTKPKSGTKSPVKPLPTEPTNEEQEKTAISEPCPLEQSAVLVSENPSIPTTTIEEKIPQTLVKSSDQVTVNNEALQHQIKQELLDSEIDKQDNQSISPVKQEVNEGIMPVEEKADEKSGETRNKRKKLLTPSTIPKIIRRSGRVQALRDLKGPQDDLQSEVSDQSDQGTKKRSSVDETTEASMSEESCNALDTSAKSGHAPSVFDSVPNSPASSTIHSEDTENIREYKLWKKSIMLAWRTAATHKYASLFSQPVTDIEAQGYHDVVYRPMDLQTIKKRIENQEIKTTVEFQRDIMLMFQNAIMYNSADHEVHQMAVEMQKEILASIEDFKDSQRQASQSTESKLRGRERRTVTASLSTTPTASDQVRFK